MDQDHIGSHPKPVTGGIIGSTIKYSEGAGEAGAKLRKTLKEQGVAKNNVLTQKQAAQAINDQRETVQDIVNTTTDTTKGTSSNVIEENHDETSY